MPALQKLWRSNLGAGLDDGGVGAQVVDYDFGFLGTRPLDVVGVSVDFFVCFRICRIAIAIQYRIAVVIEYRRFYRGRLRVFHCPRERIGTLHKVEYPRPNPRLGDAPSGNDHVPTLGAWGLTPSSCAKSSQVYTSLPGLASTTL